MSVRGGREPKGGRDVVGESLEEENGSGLECASDVELMQSAVSEVGVVSNAPGNYQIFQ